MNSTAWSNYQTSGDDLHDRLRASTAPMAGYPAHPISLVPGQVSRANALPNFRPGASRRMSIADDIRNAHNIPGPTSLPSSPTVPLYPAFAGAEEFQPRPAPPVPSSTPPPPRPPLPPSLTAAAFRKPVSPPPIPPKPYTAPSSPQEDGRLLGFPISLLPGNHATQVLDRLSESPEPQMGEGEIAVAMALSASVCDQEENQRQKLALQEEEDIVRALKASMLDSGHSHVDDAFPVPSSSRIVPGQHNEVSDEAFARSLVLERGQSASFDAEPALSQSGTSNDHKSSAATSKQNSPTIAPFTGAREPTPPTDLTLPGSSLRAASPSILPAKHEAHIEHGVPSPSPSILSDLSHLPPAKEKEVPRVESVSEVHLPYTDTTTCFTRSPEPITDAFLLNQVPSGSGNLVPGRRGSPSNNPVERSPPVPPKVKQAYSNPVSNTSNLPLYSSRAATPTGGKSTPILNPSFVAESSTASGSGELSDAVFSGSLPSYTEKPFPTAEENIKQNTSHTITQGPSQISGPTPISRPSSASASPSIQHRIPYTASQIESRAGSSTGHLSRNSSAHSSPDPDGRSSDLHSVRPGSSSTINVNAFVNKDLFVGVSVGFMSPKVSSQLIPMVEEMPPIISLPYGKSRPLHLQGPSWRHLLKLMASLSGTRVEAALDAIATIKATPKLRTVIQFVKPNPASPVWRTIFYFTIDYPPPRPSVRHRSVNELPFSYRLTEVPTLLRNAAESPLSRTYTIPASDSVPFPTLPITFPNLALYLQAALEESRRYINDSHSDYRKLAKMITTCYPDEDITPDPSERRGLFKRVMGLSNKPQKRGGNEDTYELVTPFVPDEWG